MSIPAFSQQTPTVICHFDPPNASPALGLTELKVNITTQRLLLVPINSDSDTQMLSLCFFSDQETMKSYNGKGAESYEETQFWTRESALCWNTNLPYGAVFKALDKKTHELVGRIGLSYGEFEGRAWLDYVVHRKKWGQKYGTEMAEAIVNHYARELKARGYGLEFTDEDGTNTDWPLEGIEAQVQIKNIASQKILKNLNFSLESDDEATRFFVKNLV